MGLWHTNRSPNLAQKTRPHNNQQQQKKREHEKSSSLLYRLTMEKKKWKNVKRRKSTSTLLGNWRKTMEHKGDNYTNWNWCVWNSNQMIIKETGGLGVWQTSGGPSKLQHYWERPEYWEESWRNEETCCHSNSSERPPTNADVKNSNE